MTQSATTPNDPLSVTTTTMQGGMAVVTVAGEFDIAGAAQYSAEVKSLPTDGRSIVLDLRDVSFLDCSGLNAVLTHRQTVLTAGGELFLRAPSDRVRRLLDLANVTYLFNIES